MSKETRKDFVLVIVTAIASAIGMASVFVACRPLAWIAILISDSYLSLVLLFAAILSDDRAFAASATPFENGIAVWREGQTTRDRKLIDQLF